MNNLTVFGTLYPSGTIPVFEGKKKEHVMEILYALAHLGPATTHEIASKVLPRDFEYRNYIKIPYSCIKKRGGIYYKLINGRIEKNKGKSRKVKEYSGLISEGYVVQTGYTINKKNHKIPLYFLTLKGCFVALGFSSIDINKLINNSAKNHLYFAYLKSILEKTSISFVKMIFTDPIRDFIAKGRLSLKIEDISYYFTMICESSYNIFFPHTKHAIYSFYWNNTTSSIIKYPKTKYIETLMDNTFYYEKPKEDWSDSLIEKYYPKKEDEIFYRDYCDRDFESKLVYRIMAQLHHAYYLADEYTFTAISRKPRITLPRSKAWRRHMYYKHHP